MWKMVKLEDICEVITKGTTPTSVGFKFENDGINFVKVESLHSDGTFLPSKFAKISDDCHLALKRSQLFKGDILFSIAGALGRTAIVTKEIVPANTNQALAILRLKSDADVDKKFLLYVLNSDGVKEQSNSNKGGVAQQNLSLTQLKNYLISLPPLAEQRRIVAKLDAAFAEIDTTIDGCEVQLSKIKNLNQKIFDNAFDAESSSVEFENIVSQKGTGLERRANLQGTNRAFKYLKMNNISSENRLILDDYTAVDASAEEVEKYSLNEGDFLFNTRNSVELVGKTAVASGLNGWLFNNNILRVKFVSGVNADYINYFFCSSDGKQQLNLRKTGTTNVAAVYYKDLQTIRIPILPEAEQDRIVSKLKAIEKQSSFYKGTLKNKISNLRNLKSGILAQELQSEAA